MSSPASWKPAAMPSSRTRRNEAPMSADVRPIKTAAEQALADAFAAAKAKLPGADGVAAQRDAAFRRFASEGLPHRRIQAWKYTHFPALMRDANPLAAPPDAPPLRPPQ